MSEEYDEIYTPWPDDDIEFIISPDWQVRRGSACGLYSYRMYHTEVLNEVDAFQLINWGMAKIRSFTLLKPWDDEISFKNIGTVIRDITDGENEGATKKSYVVERGGKFLRVNREWLIKNDRAVETNEGAEDEIEIDIDYSKEDSPWESDGIFFDAETLKKEKNVEIKRGRSEGTYRLLFGMISYNRKACDLLTEGLAQTLKEYKKSLYKAIIDQNSQEKVFETQQYTLEFIKVIAKKYHLHSTGRGNFSFIEEFFEMYDAFESGNIERQKKYFINELTEVDPTIAENYQKAAEALAEGLVFLNKEKEKLSEILEKAKEEYQKFSKSAGILSEDELKRAKNELFLHKQKSYSKYYDRAVFKSARWEEIDCAADDVIELTIGMQGIFFDIAAAVSGYEETLKKYYDTLLFAEGLSDGEEEEENELTKRLSDFANSPAFGEIDEILSEMSEIRKGFKKTVENVRKNVGLVLLERKVLQEKRAQLDEIKNKLLQVEPPSKKGQKIGKIRLKRSDVALTVKKNGKGLCDGREWIFNGCYDLKFSDIGMVVSEGMLIYLELI